MTTRTRLALLTALLLALVLSPLVIFKSVDTSLPPPVPVAQPSNVTKVYDVTSLLTETRPVPQQPDKAKAEVEAPKLPPSTQPAYSMNMHRLISLVEGEINRNGQNAGVRIDEFKSKELIVSAPPETQKLVDAFLKNLRGQIVQIALTSRIVAVDADTLKRANIGAAQTPSTFLTADQLKSLLSLSHKATHAPRVTLINDQGASLYQITYTPYVAGLNASTENGKQIFAPKVEYAKDGFAISISARADAALSSVLVGVAVKEMNFLGLKTVADPRREGLQYQVAQTDNHQANALVTIPKGLSAMLPLSKNEVAIVTPEILSN